VREEPISAETSDLCVDSTIHRLEPSLAHSGPKRRKKQRRKMYNELRMSYELGDGRSFDVERGKVTAQIGIEGHGMFGLKVHYDWGVSTSDFFNLDTVVDWDVPLEDRTKIPKDYSTDLIKEFLSVFGIEYGYFDAIRDAEIYIIFSERNVPAGFVNIKDTQNFLIFEDFFGQYSLEQE
jgi:hypothetical protein